MDTPDLIDIDGSKGEGGGQVLRTSLALSILTGKPFRIDRIRARRTKPGLRNQHLTCVEAAARISGGRAHGARVGASTVTFEPDGVRPGSFTFDIGTAGSTVLVLQTVLYPLLMSDGPSQITLRGGTHNSAAPPYDFLVRALVPLLERQGWGVDVELERAGFYPKGGGELRVRLRPCKTPERLTLLERGAVQRTEAEAIVARLPANIAHREINVIDGMLSLDASAVHEIDSDGPGNVMFVALACEHVTEVFTGFGQRGLRAEAIARGVGDAARTWLDAGVPVGPHLADQLLLPLSIAGGGAYRTTTPTQHTRTNAGIIERFLPVAISFQEQGFDDWRVDVTAR